MIVRIIKISPFWRKISLSVHVVFDFTAFEANPHFEHTSHVLYWCCVLLQPGNECLEHYKYGNKRATNTEQIQDQAGWVLEWSPNLNIC